MASAEGEEIAMTDNLRRLVFGPRPNRFPTLSREDRRTARDFALAAVAIVAACIFMLINMGL